MTQQQFDGSDSLFEIAKFMGSIPVILDNIERVINDIPHVRDHENIITQLTELKASLSRIHERFDIHFESSEKNYEELHKSFIEMKNLIDAGSICAHEVKKSVESIIKIMEHFDLDKYKTHTEKVDKLYDMLCKEGFNIEENITSAGKFVAKIEKELERWDYILQGSIKPEDIKEVVEFAKRGNEKDRKWNTKRKIIFGVIAAIVTLIIFADRIIFIGNVFEALKEGKSVEKVIEE